MRFILALLAGVALFPWASSAATTAEKKVLHVDCSLTGTKGQICIEETQKWAKSQSVEVQIKRLQLTSTEKLKQYQKTLSSSNPKLDVFGIDITWPSMLHKELLDLGPYLDGHKDKFLPVYLENNTVLGHLRALPFELSLGLLYYRKDLLKKYGIEVPQTWEELETASLLIQEKERKAGKKDFWSFVFQGSPYEGLTCNALEWIGSRKGGALLTTSGRVLVNTKNVHDSLKLASSWIGRISPKEVLHFKEFESYRFFKEGNAAFLRGWPSAWALFEQKDSKVRDQVGIAVLPRGGERGVHASVLGGWSLAASSKTKHPKLAASLILHLTSDDVQRRLTREAAIAPVLKSLYADAELLKKSPFLSVLEKSLPYAVTRPSELTRNYYPQVSEIFWKGVHQNLEGKMSSLEAASQIQKDLGQISGRWRR